MATIASGERFKLYQVLHCMCFCHKDHLTFDESIIGERLWDPFHGGIDLIVWENYMNDRLAWNLPKTYDRNIDELLRRVSKGCDKPRYEIFFEVDPLDKIPYPSMIRA